MYRGTVCWQWPQLPQLSAAGFALLYEVILLFKYEFISFLHFLESFDSCRVYLTQILKSFFHPIGFLLQFFHGCFAGSWLIYDVIQIDPEFNTKSFFHSSELKFQLIQLILDFSEQMFYLFPVLYFMTKRAFLFIKCITEVIIRLVGFIKFFLFFIFSFHQTHQFIFYSRQ